MARPRRVFTDEEEAKILQMALDNCHMDTIALALDIPLETLRRHYGGYISQKRAEGRTELRRMQREQAPKSPAMAIFLGKNELGQVDKQIIETEAVEQKKLNESEAVEARKIATILYLAEARKGKEG